MIFSVGEMLLPRTLGDTMGAYAEKNCSTGDFREIEIIIEAGKKKLKTKFVGIKVSMMLKILKHKSFFY